MDKPDNPPAFPDSIGLDGSFHSGMSLRDYFAGQALAGLTADGRCISGFVAADAYKYADAMLKAREASNG